MTESVVVLKDKNWLAGEGSRDGIPVHGVREVDIEICDDWLALPRHVSGRREIGLLDVLQLLNQSLLRRTTGARIPLNRPLVDHDRESESGMRFRLGHYQLGRLVNTVVGPIPINDDALNAAADHVGNLPMHLRRVVRAVADVHMVRSAKPQKQVSIDLGIRAGVEQRMHIHFADISGGRIAVCLVGKRIGRASIVRSLRS